MTRRGAVSLLALATAGCGFRLRRWEIAGTFDTVRIDADRSVDLDHDLRQALTAAGVHVVDERASIVMTLARQRAERRSVAVTGAARTAEYELSLQVHFAVGDGDGGELAPSRLLRSERVARLDRDNIVGSSEEQALLRAELRRDLIGRMLRTLGALADDAAGS